MYYSVNDESNEDLLMLLNSNTNDSSAMSSDIDKQLSSGNETEGKQQVSKLSRNLRKNFKIFRWKYQNTRPIGRGAL